MLETAAAGETLAAVGAWGRGDVRRCRALYAMAEVDEVEVREVDWEKQRWVGARQRGASESIDTAVQMRLDAIVRATDLTGDTSE
jgi:hypothetical protein